MKYNSNMNGAVNNGSADNPGKKKTGLLRPDLEDYCPASNLAFNEKVKQMIKDGHTIYHFGFGQAPFPIMDSMVNSLVKHAGENAYLAVAGIPELRKEIADLHRHYDKLDDIDPDNIIVGPGTKELIFLLENVFNGDVLVVSPTWTTYSPQALLAHHKPYIIETTYEDEWRVTPEAIEQTVLNNDLKENRLLVLCNPDNPTGTIYEGHHLQKISEVCRRHNILVLSDEIYSRLHYTQSHQTLVQYYPEGTILSSGFSKWASAGGWRIGYHVYPPQLSELRDAVKSAASHTYSCAPAPIQYAVAEGLSKKEECDIYMKHTSRILKAVGEYCHRELSSIGVKVVLPKAGYYCFPDFEVCREAFSLRGIQTGTQMCEAMFEEAKVALMSGGPAFLRPVHEFTVRLCYVNFDGKKGLEASLAIGLDQQLGEDFVKKYARPAYDGIQALKHWVTQQLKTVA